MSFRPPYAPGPRLENRLAVACVLAGLVLAGILIVRILLPWLVGAGLVATGVWCWRRQQEQQRALHRLFYEQLEVHRGRISVLEFAMASQLTGAEARAFLDARAREFFANFEPIDSGDILYTFQAPARPMASPAVDAISAPVPQVAVSHSALQLTTTALAKRLGCDEFELLQQRHQPNFSQWSRKQDPDSCSWTYNSASDRYSPLPKDV